MSEKKRAYILSGAAIGPHGDIDGSGRRPLTSDVAQADVSDLVKELTGQEMRRAGHFTELAVIGSMLTVKRLGVPLSPSTPVYLATGLGEVHSTVALFKQLMAGEAGSTSPYDFVNSVSNTSAFQVAKTLGLTSQNLTISQEELSFEYTLGLAVADVRDGLCCHAIVGGIDEFHHPRKEHMARLPLNDDQIMGEGGGWLCLGSDDTGALGTVLGVTGITADTQDSEGWCDAAAEAIRPWLTPGADALLMPGLRMKKSQIDGLVKRLDGIKVRDYLCLCGCFHTAAAFGLASIFDFPHARDTIYVHVNPDTEGRAMMVGVHAYGARGI